MNTALYYAKRICLISVASLLVSLGVEAKVQDIPRSEHPNPQAIRAEWTNLNGIWEFAETDNDNATYLGDESYPDKITVPFCRESKLSGLARRGFIRNVWYRRTFDAPTDWKSPRIRLHIGACDWKTSVWLNGHNVGEHIGGNAPFAFDITEFTTPGKNTIIVHAFDDTRSGLQACGKQSQSLESQGCSYTRTTGIWQTVWIEGVGSSFIGDFKVEPDAAHSRIMIQTEVDGHGEDLTVKAVAYAGGKVVGTAEALADWRNNQLVLDLSEKHLWSIENPFLYDLKLSLVKGNKTIDQIDSYFGLRSVSIKGAAILINGKPVFQRTVLDQGFYPDGIWTAPSEEALKNDILLSQALGFNGARLHQKVFEPRFLYWADKLGYIVWGEFPNWGLLNGDPRVNLPVIDEWVEIVRRDRNHPSIIGWCPFNETRGEMEPIQNTVVNMTRAIDPTRPIIDSSGWSHGLPNPEVLDAHDYDQNPVSFRTRWLDAFTKDSNLPSRYGRRYTEKLIPFFVSEYGGIGWDTGSAGWGYGQAPKELEEFYNRYEGLTNALLDSRFMFGFSYTQLTDVEQERNGLYTYDRKPKFDVERIHKINSRKAAYETDPPYSTRNDNIDWQVLIGAYPDGDQAKEWRYSFDAPENDWMNPSFNDSSWKTGLAGFGKKDNWVWEKAIRTPWAGSDIWIRQEFDCKSTAFDKALLAINFDNDAKIYVNGKLIREVAGYSDGYIGFDVTLALKDAIKPGKNVIAIHCQQDDGGQFIDAALLVSTTKK